MIIKTTKSFAQTKSQGYPRKYQDVYVQPIFAPIPRIFALKNKLQATETEL